MEPDRRGVDETVAVDVDAANPVVDLTLLQDALDDYFNSPYEIVTADVGHDETIAKVYGAERPRPDPDDENADLPFHCVFNNHTGLLGVYSNDWFERLVIRHWQKHILPHGWEFRRYLEIGVCEGRSMRWVMENTGVRWAYGVDPWEPPRVAKTKMFRRYEERAQKNLRPWLGRRRPRVRLVREKSYRWLFGPDQPPDESCDMIYVDGDHRGHVTMMDLVGSWMKLKIGGFMVIDDVNRRWAHSKPSTWEAYRGFEIAYDHLFDWVYRTRKQVCLRKHHHI